MSGAMPPLTHVIRVCRGTILALAEQVVKRNVEAKEYHIERTTKMSIIICLSLKKKDSIQTSCLPDDNWFLQLPSRERKKVLKLVLEASRLPQ
jgi:hypothetical protein